MISIILILIAGILNSIMDVLKYRFHVSIFKNFDGNEFINPVISWKNKWNENGKEKFFGSSTFLAFLTDLWHLCKFLMLVCISLAIVNYTMITDYLLLDAFILYCTFTITFELFYSKILIYKNKN